MIDLEFSLPRTTDGTVEVYAVSERALHYFELRFGPSVVSVGLSQLRAQALEAAAADAGLNCKVRA